MTEKKQKKKANIKTNNKHKNKRKKETKEIKKHMTAVERIVPPRKKEETDKTYNERMNKHSYVVQLPQKQ